MSKRVDDTLNKAWLDKLATCTDIAVCAGDPGAGTAGFALAEIGGTNHLANKVTATGEGNGVYGDYADGNPNGRTVTIAAITTANASASGTGDHLVFMNATRVLFVTTLTNSVSVTSGQPVTLEAFPLNLADPV